MKKSICSNVLPKVSTECNCDYIPPPIKKLFVRKNKDGQIQVKINRERRWRNAELDGNILRFFA